MVNEQILEQLWKEHLSDLDKGKWKPHNFILDKFYSLRIHEILFKLFETSITPCKSDGSNVIVSQQLSSDSLQGLIENKICAIHVPNFCALSIAENLSKKALEEYTHWKLRGVVNTDMFYAGGSIPKEAAHHSWPDFCRYFREREDFIFKQRAASDGAWPVDRLRLALDEAWPFGAHVDHWLGQKLRPAIMRVMHPQSDFKINMPTYGFIHTDDTPKLKSTWGTFSANIYLKIPEEGGELYIWSVNLNETKDIHHYWSAQLLSLIQGSLFDMELQEKILKFLPSPHIIKPQTGDLIIFNSGRFHSVVSVKKGTRVTNQLFIGARGQAPLIMWS